MLLRVPLISENVYYIIKFIHTYHQEIEMLQPGMRQIWTFGSNVDNVYLLESATIYILGQKRKIIYTPVNAIFS